MTRGDSQSKDSHDNGAEPQRTPAELGYRWPAEWETHAATWLAWPHNPNTWPGKFEVIPPIFGQFVRIVARYEPVRLLCGGEATLASAREHVGGAANVELIEIETNDAWIRDHGPTFIKAPDGSKALVDWEYNAWGNKYPPFDKDNRVPAQIAERLGLRRFTPGLVLEGGAIEGNGEGVIMTTESCLLNPNRNPGCSRADIEQALRDYLNARQILWLSGGDFAGDDTDGHIDQLARFVGPRTVVVASCDRIDDENFGVLETLYQQLQAVRLEDGSALSIERLPIPSPKYHDNHRLPASYCNFYLTNGAVIVPAFSDPADEIAAERLGQLFPDRQIELLGSLDLVWGLGAMHCLSQQEPA